MNSIQKIILEDDEFDVLLNSKDSLSLLAEMAEMAEQAAQSSDEDLLNMPGFIKNETR